MTPDVWVVLILAALVMAVFWWSNRVPGKERTPKPPPAAGATRIGHPPQLFEVRGRRQPGVVVTPAAAARRTGGRATVGAADPPRAGVRRRSRADAPCWICGTPRKADCQFCEENGPT